MKTLTRAFLIYNALFFVINIVIHYAGISLAHKFDLRAQMIVAVPWIAAFLIFRAPFSIAWFGSKLDSNHEANRTISYAMAVFLNIVPTILNTVPMMVLLGLTV